MTSPARLGAALALALSVGCRGSPRHADAAPAGPPDTPIAACPPLTVAVDGVAVTELHGLAVTLTNGIYRTEQVELYDRATVDCATVMAPGFRPPEGALAVRAYYHAEAQGLGTEAHTEMGIAGITLLARAARIGETTALCVPRSTFVPSAGRLDGHRITIAGTVAGIHCGVKDLTPP